MALNFIAQSTLLNSVEIWNGDILFRQAFYHGKIYISHTIHIKGPVNFMLKLFNKSSHMKQYAIVKFSILSKFDLYVEKVGL